jgi:hypothetical protein
LPTPGILVRRPASCSPPQSLSRSGSTGQHRQASRADPLILSNRRNDALRGSKPVQQMRIFAHDELRVHTTFSAAPAGCRACSSASAHGHAYTSSKICGGFFSSRMPVKRPIISNEPGKLSYQPAFC